MCRQGAKQMQGVKMHSILNYMEWRGRLARRYWLNKGSIKGKSNRYRCRTMMLVLSMVLSYVQRALTVGHLKPSVLLGQEVKVVNSTLKDRK